MMYGVYDESGRITQANQVYAEDSKLEPMMRDLGQNFIKADRSLISPDYWYVMIKEQRFVERQLMPITVSNKTLRAGTTDSAIIRGIPKGVRCSIVSSNFPLYDMVMNEDELELTIPVPCVYRVKFSLWPYQDTTIDVEGIEP